MKNPTVSFVVPCYKLAHLLPECINSILSQSYIDFEVLVMDDCSPDNTGEVARSFQDPRVRHIRNDPNLGHLRNYNKGIALARGRYVWLISADDCLRRPYVLERYVEQLERNHAVGFACCPGVALRHGKETGILHYSVYAVGDCIVRGHEFLKKLLKSNIVLAASGLVRRECYERLGAFPVDMPYAGDWYLWCLFALYYDVAFFAEPMVYYREHNLSMTNALMSKSVAACVEEDVAISWIIKQKADAAGFETVSRNSLYALGYIYGRSMSLGRYQSANSRITWEQFEASVGRNTNYILEKNIIYSTACAVMGDDYYSMGDFMSAKRCYLTSIDYNPRDAKVYAKLILITLGKLGISLRKAISMILHRGRLNGDDLSRRIFQ